MVTYKTPNVYVEEISTFPPSVAEVSTAIPAFIGYTEKAPGRSEVLPNKPILTRISSLLDYETLFGKAQATDFNVVESAGGIEPIITPELKYLMYYALRMYFDNGGGSCYIVSVGGYSSTGLLIKEDFIAGLSALEQEDEPTLILLTDAVNLTDEVDYYDLCQKALAQCNKLKERFAIFDVLPLQETTQNGGVDKFRGGIGTGYLKYGAAYHPYLQTSLNYYYTDDFVTVTPQRKRFEYKTNDNGIIVSYTGNKSDEPKVAITVENANQESPVEFEINTSNKTLTIKLQQASETVENIIAAWKQWKNSGNSNDNFEIKQNGLGSVAVGSSVNETPLTPLHLKLHITKPNSIVVTHEGEENDQPKVVIHFDTNQGINIDFEIEIAQNTKTLKIKLKQASETVENIIAAWKQWKNSGNSNDNFEIKQNGDGSVAVDLTVEGEKDLTEPPTLRYYKTANTDLYNKVKTEIGKMRVVLPPSAAVVGAYARVDRDRGVWKAPANVSLASLLAPTVKITNEEQENLNVDPTAGKSINAIRSFTGKGTLIWGARTLAGNDNEWRYINVRRLFNLIEESIQKATAFVVFESNDAITWLKVKSLIDIYLERLWRQGALAGSTPEQAFFVHIGLGKTMTTQDILEGRMIVEIGIAAVRPAEFIILKFSHKLQEA